MKFNITATIVHHHYNHSDEETKQLLKTIIKNQNKMSEQTDAIMANLDAAIQINEKIVADIAALNATIQSATTLAELEAIKTKSADLVSRLQTTDALTPDASPEGGE